MEDQVSCETAPLNGAEQLKLVSLSPQEARGIRGVAVKCIDITKNSDCEGSALGRH